TCESSVLMYRTLRSSPKIVSSSSSRPVATEIPMPRASDVLPTPPGDAITVISPRTRSRPYNHWRCGMFENEILRGWTERIGPKPHWPSGAPEPAGSAPDCNEVDAGACPFACDAPLY